MKNVIYMLIIVALTWPGTVQSNDWKFWNDDKEPAEYYTNAIRVRAVDAETSEPIEGAVVIAQWRLEAPFGGYAGGAVDTMKAVTDKDGWFVIPANGPIKRPKFTMLKQQDPILIISKVGYKTVSLINANREYLIKNGITVRKLEKDSQGKPIKIIVKTVRLDNVDSETLGEGISQDYSEEIIPKGPTRECIWNGKTIRLKKEKLSK